MSILVSLVESVCLGSIKCPLQVEDTPHLECKLEWQQILGSFSSGQIRRRLTRTYRQQKVKSTQYDRPFATAHERLSRHPLFDAGVCHKAATVSGVTRRRQQIVMCVDDGVKLDAVTFRLLTHHQSNNNNKNNNKSISTSLKSPQRCQHLIKALRVCELLLSQSCS